MAQRSKRFGGEKRWSRLINPNCSGLVVVSDELQGWISGSVIARMTAIKFSLLTPSPSLDAIHAIASTVPIWWAVDSCSGLDLTVSFTDLRARSKVWYWV